MIVLPVATAPGAVAKGVLYVARESQMPRILIVDDDKAVQEMLADTLREAGYEAHLCRDGKQALVELGRIRYDLLILDVLIPHMNGFVLIEHIRGRPDLADLPVVMISGIYRSRNHRDEMTTRFGVIDYLDKPFTTERLMELVERAAGPAGTSIRDVGTEDLVAQSGEWSESNAIVDADDLTLTQGIAPVPLTRKKHEPVPLDRIKGGEPGAQAARSRATTKRGPACADLPSRLVDTTTRQEKKAVEAEARESFQTSAFVMQGSLAKVPVVGVLGKLWHHRSTGALLLRRGRIKKIVYLKSGNPVLVKSNLVSECLGQILLRERLISKQECEASVRSMKKTRQRQGEILVQMGSLTRRNLEFALELQLETKLFDTFVWDNGEYRFNASTPVADKSIDWTGPAIVAEGIRRTFDETRLRALMLPVIDVALEFGDDIFRDLQAMKLNEREQKAVGAILPGKTTRELLDSMPVGYPDALRIIYTLITLELLRPAV
jgi:CheY-like chemotaxis protein